MWNPLAYRTSPRPRAAGSLASLALLLSALLFLVLPSPTLAAAPVCDESSPLSLLAFDTSSGQALFSQVAGDGSLAVLKVWVRGEEASHYTQSRESGSHFAGSVGPGPPFALRRCGEGCAQADTFHDGAWRPLGNRLRVKEAANLYATYDRDGYAWLLVHSKASTPPWIYVDAFRLERGGWQSQGSLAVHSPSSLGASPAPEERRGVISGNGLFVAGQEPRIWLRGRPALPENRGGQVLSLDGEAVTYVDGEGNLYFSKDRGQKWTRSRWTPWGVTRTRVWSYGTDYSLDLPLGTLGSPLPVAWFDRRPGQEAKIFLSELEPDGTWKLRAELPPEIRDAEGGQHELFHILRTAGGAWLLLTDCLAVKGEAQLLYRQVSLAGVEPVRKLRVVPRLPTREMDRN